MSGERIKVRFFVKRNFQLNPPNLYKVILLNDDFTPMDFVEYILMSIFNKSKEEANKIVFKVHNNGSGVCGIYSYEIAETKVTQVLSIARRNQYPLRCILEITN